MVLYIFSKKHLAKSHPAHCKATKSLDVSAHLLCAALNGHTAVVRVLLERGADVNVRDANGWTPLMEAVFAGRIEAAQVLLESGADVDAADNNGWTVLMEAASKGRQELVMILLGYGANVRARSGNGWTALKATQKGNAEIQRMLRQAGAKS